MTFSGRLSGDVCRSDRCLVGGAVYLVAGTGLGRAERSCRAGYIDFRLWRARPGAGRWGVVARAGNARHRPATMD